VKGHAATLFCPIDRITLRTGFRENAWTKRPKPPRDYRGQIIRDDF